MYKLQSYPLNSPRTVCLPPPQIEFDNECYIQGNYSSVMTHRKSHKLILDKMNSLKRLFLKNKNKILKVKKNKTKNIS